MQYQPKKNKKGCILALCALVGGALGLLFAITSEQYFSTWFFMPAVFIFLMGFEILFRYEWTSFIYEIHENELTVWKKTGKKTECVCLISVDTILAIVPKSDRKKRKSLQKEYGKPDAWYNFTQTVHAKKTYLIFVFYEKGIRKIVLEPNEAFLSHLQMVTSQVQENE